jgi:hypothetical protein
MEFLTIFLSVLLGLVSPIGFGVDRVAENAIREQFTDVEDLAVRIDNAPSYRFVQGRADRVRIAGRGLYLTEAIRLAVLEVETDAIVLNPGRLRAGTPQLEEPLQAAIRLVLTEADINQALQSEAILGQLGMINLGAFGGVNPEPYELLEPQVTFLETDRVQLQVTLQGQQTGDRNQITVESGLEIVNGRQFRLVSPSASVNGSPLPSQLLDFLVLGINQRLDLANLEASGITARVLKLEIAEDELTLVSFIQVAPNASLPDVSLDF